VLVPVYNTQRYVEQCLDSLAAQTFTDFEVICVNDGSTDDSARLIRRFVDADHRFRLIEQKNAGYGAAMNRALAAARGSWVGILESDDFMEPATLKALVGALGRFDAQVVKANCYFHWSTPRSRDSRYWLVPRSQTGRPINPQEQHAIFYLKPSIWSALYERAFLERNRITFLETPGASYQDASFNFKVWAQATRVVFLRDAYVHYRQDNEGSSVNSADKIFCICEEYEEMARFLAEDPLRRARLGDVLNGMRYDSYVWNYERLADELQPLFLERFRQDFVKLAERGELNLGSFRRWKALDLRTIMDEPRRYHEQRRADGGGMRGKLRHALRIGGPSLPLEMIWEKLTRA
jgi:glycosyltransferase involved in cell wall biosynthesis